MSRTIVETRVPDIKVELPSGEVVWARLPDAGQPVNVGAAEILHQLDSADLRNTIQGVSHTVREALQGLRPDDVTIGFGIQLGVKTGKLTSILAEASGTASITVTVGWRRETLDAAPPAPLPREGSTARDAGS